MEFPKIIATTAIRSTYKGESHGGAYIVDLENEEYKQVIDWNKANIDCSGRGVDRGLRGIVFYDGNIYIAESDEIFMYNQNFKLINSYINRYLKHCHEIFIINSKLYSTSTGYNSILEFDLVSEKFVYGYYINFSGIKSRLNKFINPKGRIPRACPWGFHIYSLLIYFMF